jgi:hypothetical protein
MPKSRLNKKRTKEGWKNLFSRDDKGAVRVRAG